MSLSLVGGHPDPYCEDSKTTYLKLETSAGYTLREALCLTNAYLHASQKRPLEASVMKVDARYLDDALSTKLRHTILDKLLVIASGMHPPHTLSFTLNFGPARQRRLSAMPAEKIIRTLRNDIGRLQRLGPVVFVLEYTNDGRPHIHGLIETRRDREEVHDALKAIGGKCDSAFFANFHQVDTEDTAPDTSPLGWCLYMTKRLVGASVETADQSVYVSPGAKLIYERQFDWLRRSSEIELALESPFWGRVGRRPSHGVAVVTPTLH